MAKREDCYYKWLIYFYIKQHYVETFGLYELKIVGKYVEQDVPHAVEQDVPHVMEHSASEASCTEA